ncbi:MAG: alkaline phosphatase D, partial [Pirellulaceae bacterium]
MNFASRLLLTVFSLVFAITSHAAPPFQATGIKVGEVDANSAIVWTRLTQLQRQNSADAPMYDIAAEKYDVTPEHPSNHPNPTRWNVKRRWSEYPQGVTVADIAFAAPGTIGETRVGYRQASELKWRWTDWKAVDADRDFTRQVLLTGLQANTKYQVLVESRNKDGRGASQEGGFVSTAASDDPAKVVFTVSTGQQFRHRDNDRGYTLYDSMLSLAPNFFVHTGDIVYYDLHATNLSEARYHWQRTYGLPTNVRFHNNVASYFIRDDHDTWTNDCWPSLQTGFQGTFTFDEGVAVFSEQVPMREKTYRTVRCGKDLQIWMVEGRNFRSPNTAEDGPNKTIWGTEQKTWLKETIADSDATFRVLISPTPIVGPDRVDNKHDNHSNIDFKHEGDEVREFLAGLKNTIVVCGDRHWQYHSIDPRTGTREYSCGPASNAHAGGWTKGDFRKDYHRFLKVAGGFLSVT